MNIEQYEKFAKGFYENNGFIPSDDSTKLMFKTPVLMRLQSMGGFVFGEPSLLVLFLNRIDGFHEIQRHYSNCLERELQAAVFVSPTVREHINLKRSVFIKTMLGPKENVSVFEHPFLTNLLTVFDVDFIIRGISLRVDRIDGKEFLYGSWIYDTMIMGAAPHQDFPDKIKPRQYAGPTPLDVWKAARPKPPPAIIAQPPKKPELDECVICLEELKERCAFVPCGHTATCWNCGQNNDIVNCPICRAAITMRLKIFM